MKKKKFFSLMVIIVVLVFGMFTVGCDDSVCVDGKCPTCGGSGTLIEKYGPGHYETRSVECHKCKGTGEHSKCGGKGC